MQRLFLATEVWWWSRPDGLMQILPATRAVEHSMQLQQYRITTPLWAAHTIMLRPNEPRTEEVNGSEQAHPFVSVLGAAWLIMSQPNLAETRDRRVACYATLVRDKGIGTAGHARGSYADYDVVAGSGVNG